MKRKIKKYNAKQEEKLKEKEEKEKNDQKKKDSEIKPFSLQSAIGIILSSLAGSIVFPFLLSLVGVKDVRLGI